MWQSDHPFNQSNKTTERAAGVGVGGDREEGWTLQINLKRGGGWGLHKTGGLGPLCQLWAH